jgi:hypothetical protein
METPIQQASRLSASQYQNAQGTAGPFEAVVVSVSASSDSMGLSFGPTRNRPMPIQHPFIGTTSWIRSIPDTGTRYLLQNRFDSGQPEALKTIPTLPGQRASDYGTGINVYRTLNPGEHDFASSGLSLAWMGKRGNFDLRSGANIKSQMSRDEQAHTTVAPTFKRELLNHQVGEMGDEERLGIVKRWTTAIDETFPQQNNQFQTEHYLQLDNPAGSAPEVLMRSIEGQVYEDDATQIMHFTTNLPLRSQKLWYTTTDDYLRREIDQNGNYLLQFPSDATTGYQMIIPNGSYSQDINLDRDVTIGRDETVQVQGDINYTVQGNVSYNLPNETFSVNASNAQLVLTGGTVALGTTEVELVNIVYQALNILSETTAAGFGAPLDTVAQFAALAEQVQTIQGTLS